MKFTCDYGSLDNAYRSNTNLLQADNLTHSNSQDMDSVEQYVEQGKGRAHLKKCFTSQRVMVLLVFLVLTVSITTIIYVHLEFKQYALNRDFIKTYMVPNTQATNESLIAMSGKKAVDISKSIPFLSIELGNLSQRQDCHGTPSKMSFPDIDYALMGYNILRGYPLATGHDPGFTLPIFTADYINGVHTADCRYNVPKGLVVVPDISCVTSFSSKIVQSGYEYAKSLSVSASVSGGGWGAKFSASAGYKESSSEIASGESVFIISTAKCNYYFSKLVQRSPPPFNPDFFKWIVRLNNTDNSDKDTYYEFFDTYGTHFATEMKLGARFAYEHKMTSENFKSIREKGVNVAVSASYHGLVSAGGGFSMDANQKQQASEFSKSVETKTITVGAAPPSNGDAMTWASTVKESPVPSEYKLESIEELFTEKYIDISQININLEKISKNIIEYKFEYCEYLFSKWEVESCLELTHLTFDNTRLFNHYKYKEHTSFTECIDHCLSLEECTAITYFGFVIFDECYLFKSDPSLEVTAKNENGWKSVFFVGKNHANLNLHQTAVVGTERKYQIKEDERIDELKCYKMCVGDIHCVIYSYCEYQDFDQKCKLYNMESELGFKAEEGTISVLVTK